MIHRQRVDVDDKSTSTSPEVIEDSLEHQDLCCDIGVNNLLDLIITGHLGTNVPVDSSVIDEDLSVTLLQPVIKPVHELRVSNVTCDATLTLPHVRKDYMTSLNAIIHECSSKKNTQ
jgi:hypothetical protein